ncbi:NigD-like N-terminal domain-containing protein, partial [uncultured Bacteroides sp.]
MKMKSIFNKKTLIAIATIGTLSFQSCLDDGDNYAVRFPNALVTVKTDADQTVFLQLDDKTTLLPTNMTKSPYGEKEVRALINYKEVDEPSDIYTQAVYINWIDSILTKP